MVVNLQVITLIVSDVTKMNIRAIENSCIIEKIEGCIFLKLPSKLHGYTYLLIKYTFLANTVYKNYLEYSTHAMSKVLATCTCP